MREDKQYLGIKFLTNPLSWSFIPARMIVNSCYKNLSGDQGMIFSFEFCYRKKPTSHSCFSRFLEERLNCWKGGGSPM